MHSKIVRNNDWRNFWLTALCLWRFTAHKARFCTCYTPDLQIQLEYFEICEVDHEITPLLEFT